MEAPGESARIAQSKTGISIRTYPLTLTVIKIRRTINPPHKHLSPLVSTELIYLGNATFRPGRSRTVPVIRRSSIIAEL